MLHCAGSQFMSVPGKQNSLQVMQPECRQTIVFCSPGHDFAISPSIQQVEEALNDSYPRKLHLLSYSNEDYATFKRYRTTGNFTNLLLFSRR